MHLPAAGQRSPGVGCVFVFLFAWTFGLYVQGMREGAVGSELQKKLN